MPPCSLVLSLLLSLTSFSLLLLYIFPPLLLGLYSSSTPFVLTPSISIYISLSFFPCSFSVATLSLIYSPCACFASSPSPSLLAPSHLRHTHLALPFIASGGWRATVSFNPSQCHLQTLTVTQRLHRCLTIKAVALSKAGRGIITAVAQQIEPPFDLT